MEKLDHWKADFSAWIPVLKSESITTKPLKIVLLEKSIVLFRNQQNSVQALDDICPHKLASLSLGRVVNGHIQCPYHGWEFSGEGHCTKIPCNTNSKKQELVKTIKYDCFESDGYIFLKWGNDECARPEFKRPNDYAWLDYEYEIEVPAPLILDNGFDCSHTCFVHSGLYRSEPHQVVSAKAETTDDGIKVTTIEKDSRKGLVTRFFPWLGDQVTHTDAYHAPFSLEVNYYFGRCHHITYLHCVPASEYKTKVMISCGVNAPYNLNFLFKLFFKYITPKIILQDKKILLSQASSIQSTKRSFSFLQESDVPSAYLWAAYRNFFKNKGAINESRVTTVEYKL